MPTYSPEMRSTLKMSTRNLSSATIVWLAEAGFDPSGTAVVGGVLPYGAFALVPAEDTCVPSPPHAEMGKHPKDLWAAFTEAERLGCHYVVFDDAQDLLLGYEGWEDHAGGPASEADGEPADEAVKTERHAGTGQDLESREPAGEPEGDGPASTHEPAGSAASESSTEIAAVKAPVTEESETAPAIPNGLDEDPDPADIPEDLPV